MTTENATKLPPAERKAVILSGAIKVANEQGLAAVTFKTTADACELKVMPRTIRVYFKIGELRRAVAGDDRANDDVRASAVAMGIA